MICTRCWHFRQKYRFWIKEGTWNIKMITTTLLITMLACYGALAFLILGIVITKKQTEEKRKMWEQYYKEKR